MQHTDMKSISILSLLSNNDESKINPTTLNRTPEISSSINAKPNTNSRQQHSSKSSSVSVTSLMNETPTSEKQQLVTSHAIGINTLLNPTDSIGPPRQIPKHTNISWEDKLNETAKELLQRTPTSVTPETEKDAKDSQKEKPEKEDGSIIINIEIPLSTHNDVHMEHNFAKIVEEKYGTQATPSAKGLWNFDNDYADGEGEGEGEGEEEEEEGEGEGEDDEYEDEDDADLAPLNNNSNNISLSHDYEEEDEIVKALRIKFTPGMSDTEKENLVLKEIHRRKMVNNKRIGKYDIEDPFIDDEELLYEEDTNTNADGWFVWHGDLDVQKKKRSNNQPNKVEIPQKIGRKPLGKGTILPSATSNLVSASSNTSVTIPQISKEKRKSEETSSNAAILKKQKTTIPSIGSQTTSSIATPGLDSTSKLSATDPKSKIIIGSFGF